MLLEGSMPMQKWTRSFAYFVKQGYAEGLSFTVTFDGSGKECSNLVIKTYVMVNNCWN